MSKLWVRALARVKTFSELLPLRAKEHELETKQAELDSLIVISFLISLPPLARLIEL
jgi:hypothetical protein